MENYFEFYSIPEAVDVDAQNLRKAYLAKSKECHPDFHTLADGDAQEEALMLSSLNNAAYTTLKNRMSRVKHILELRGAIQEGDMVSQDFLIEAMDVNEAIMELEFDPSPPAEEKAQMLVDELNAGLEKGYDSMIGASTEDATLIADLKEWYYRKKYIDRMVENLKKASSR